MNPTEVMIKAIEAAGVTDLTPLVLPSGEFTQPRVMYRNLSDDMETSISGRVRRSPTVQVECQVWQPVRASTAFEPSNIENAHREMNELLARIKENLGQSGQLLEILGEEEIHIDEDLNQAAPFGSVVVGLFTASIFRN